MIAVRVTNRCPSDDGGYAMAMLLVAIGVMAILWTAAMPVWSQIAKREREAELIFRGGQYARAIELYQRKYANANPPSIEALLEEKFLRQAYRDPMVPDGEFQLLHPRVQVNRAAGPGSVTTETGSPMGPSRLSERLSSFVSRASRSGESGIVGVVSRSDEEALRVYEGKTRYNEWQFTYPPVGDEAAPSGPTPTAGARAVALED